jgi:urease subunit gamma/beta
MALDREAAFGMRLDIPSGTAVRFEPGQSRKVQITTYAGREVAYGMNNMTNGSVRSDLTKERTMRRLRADGYCFEGDRYPVRPSADSKYSAKGKQK